MRIVTAIPLLVLAATIASPGCAPVRVRSYANSAVELQHYRSYAWDETGPGATGDPRLDNNRFFRERVVLVVDRELANKGYVRVAGDPDLTVRLHVGVEQKVAGPTVNADRTLCQDEECRRFAFDEGTLLLDFIDARTSRLAWRGWSESDVEGVIDDQDWMNDTIDRLVTKILMRFPRRG